MPDNIDTNSRGAAFTAEARLWYAVFPQPCNASPLLHAEVTVHQNVLPGQQQPYFLESGEGQRYLLGPFLATIIGNRQDTGSLMEGVVLIGAAVMPLHRHNNSHEAIYVLEGSAVCGLRTRNSRSKAAIMRASHPAPRMAFASPAIAPGY
jgi:hypothetical protein